MRALGFLFVFVVVVGFVFAPFSSVRVEAVLARASVVVDEGVIFDEVYDSGFPRSWVPFVLNVSSLNVSYPKGLDRFVVDRVSGVLERDLVGVSHVSVVFAPLGLFPSDIGALDDPVLSVVFERAQLYGLARSDFVIPLFGEAASLEALVSLVVFLESRGIPYDLFVFAHGFVYNDSVGILAYSDGDIVFVDASVLRHFTGLSRSLFVDEFVLVSCFAKTGLASDTSFSSFFSGADESLVYGEGETLIPQEVIDLFDSVIVPYEEVHVYPAAIVENATVSEGYLIIIKNVTVEEVTLYTDTKLGFTRGIGPRMVKTVKTRITVKATKSPVTPKPPISNLRGQILQDILEATSNREAKNLNIEVTKLKSKLTYMKAEYKLLEEDAEKNNIGIADISKEFWNLVSNTETLLDKALKTSDGSKKSQYIEQAKANIKKTGELLNKASDRVTRGIANRYKAIKENLEREMRKLAKKAEKTYVTPEKIKKIVLQTFTTAKRELKNYMRKVVAMVIPEYVGGERNPVYDIAVSVGDANIDAAAPTSTILINWLLSQDNFAFTATQVLRVIRDEVNAVKAVVLFIEAKALETVKDLLNILNRGVEWLIEKIGAAANIPDKMVRDLKELWNRNYETVINIIDGVAAYLKDEASKAIQEMSDELGQIISTVLDTMDSMFNEIKSTVNDAIDSIINSITEPLWEFMLQNAQTEEETVFTPTGKTNSTIKPLTSFPQRSDTFDYVLSMSILSVKGWKLNEAVKTISKEKLMELSLIIDPNKVIYLAKRTFAIPYIAEAYLKIRSFLGEKGLFATILTNEILVRVKQGKNAGELYWINTMKLANQEDKKSGMHKLLAEINGEIVEVESLGVSRWTINAYVLDEHGELRVIPMLYVGARKNIDSKAAKALDIMLSYAIDENYAYKLSDNKKGTSYLIVLDREKIIHKDKIYEKFKSMSEEQKIRNLFAVLEIIGIRETTLNQNKDNKEKNINVKEIMNEIEKNMVPPEKIKEYTGEISALVERFSTVMDPKGKLYPNDAADPISLRLLLAIGENKEKNVKIIADPYWNKRRTIATALMIMLHTDVKYAKTQEEKDQLFEKLRKIYNDYKLPIINEKGTIYYNSKGYGKGDKRSKIYSITEGWRRPSKTTKMEIVNLFIHNLLVAEYQAKIYDLNPEAIKLAITTPEGTKQTTLEQLINIKEKMLKVFGRQQYNPNWFDDAWKRKLTPEEKLLLVGVVGLTEDVRGKPQSQWLNVVKNPVAYLEGKPVVDLPKQELANVLDKLNLGELDINLEYIGKASSDIITEELNLKIRGETGRPDRIEVPILNFKNSFTQLVREVDEAIRITSDPAERVKLETLKRKLEGTVELLDGMITRWKGGSRRNLKAMAVAGVAMSALKQGYLLYKFGQALFIAGAKTALELILASPRIAAYIASTPWLQTLLGGILSTVFFILSNIDLSYFKSMKTNGLSALTRIVSVETTEALEKLDKAGMILSFYLGGFSTILKSIGVQFYFPEEIVYVIGDALNKVAEGVGDVWNTIMGFKIPLLDQTVFEILASYLLSGPLNTILGIIIGLLVQKLLAPLLDKIIIQGLIILAFNT